MNKIYRLVWNKSLNLWTVVSENARGVTKKRNVTANTDVQASTLVQADLKQQKQYQPITTVLALTISSVLWSTGAFAAANTGGGTSNDGTSMAISPTASQCAGVGEASVSSGSSVAIGCGNSISGTDPTLNQAMANRRGTGNNNYPTGTDRVTSASTAVGKNNKITNPGGATVYGNSNVSDGTGNFQNVAIGTGNRTGGPGFNTTLGIGNEITTGNSSTAIGVNNRATGNTAIVMGRNSWADADFSISLGNTATVASGATGGIALGNSSNTSGVRGIAIGSGTGGSQNDQASAASASGVDSIALGTGAKGTGNQSTASGRQAKATGANSSAYGNEANANGTSSVAVGDKAKAQGNNDIAIGLNAATASGGSNNIAVGNGVTTGATGQNVAMGSGTTTANSASSTGGAVAIGRDQKATGDGAVALGDPNTANGNGTVALGRNNTAAGDTAGNTAANGAVAIGNENKAIGQGAVALGNASTAAAAGAVALGDTANAKASNGVALGSNAVANNADDVALGSGSQTAAAVGTESTTIRGETYQFAGTNPTSTVSVGSAGAERTITNVAAGRISATSTDAINGSQLYATNQAIENLEIGVAAANSEVTEGKNITVTETVGAVGQSIYQVATADDVDFNNVTVGGANGVSIDGSTGKISGVAAGDVNPDSTEAINGSQLANNAQSVADALGGGSSVNPDGTVTAPNYNVNGTSLSNVGDAITELDKGWNLQSNGANSGAVKAGDTVDIGTADGEENLQVAKDGNNIKYSLNRDLKVDSVTAGDTVINNDGMTITGGPSVTKAGIDAGNQKITGVAPGTVSADSTDAINGSQLHAQGEGVKNIIGGNTQYDPDTGTYTNPDIGGTGKDNINDAIGAVGKAASAAKTEVEAGKNMTVESTTGTDGQTIYTVATADDVEFNSVKVGDVNIDGTTGKISGVAAGDVNPDSTDAVNGSQLANNAQSVADALGGGSTVNPDGTVSAPKYTVNGNNVSNVGDAITELDKGWTLQSNGANASAVKAGDTVDIGTADDEENLQVVKEGNSIKYSLSRDLNVDSVTAGDTLINTDGMTIAGGPSVTKAGINAGNRKITGVAPGAVSADSTEAINGSQLHAQGEGVKNIIGGDTQYDPNTGKYTNANIGGTGKDNINDAIGAVGDAAKAAKSTVSNKDGNITVNETTKPDGSRDYEVGLAKDIKVDSVTAGGTKVDGDGLHIEGGPSVTKDGIDAGDKKVTGVADGTVAKDSKDAVNGGQLKGVSDSVANVIGGNTTVNPDGSLTTSDIGGTGKNNVNDAIESVKNDAKAAKTTVSKKDDNLTVNKTQNDDGSTNYEVGLADKIKVKQVDADQVNVAGDQGKTSISGGGISITGPKGEQGPSMTTGGINAGGKKVTGVADGAIAKDSQDAVNGSQLHQSYQDVGAALGGGAGYDPAKGWTGPSYEVGGAKHDNVGDALGALDNADKALGDRITNLGDQMQQAFYDTNQRIDDVKKHANAGVAAAMALETAPYISGKYTYAVGAAYHGGENAVGVTLRKTADNGRWSLTTGVAAASQGDPSFRVGLSGVFD